MCITMFKKGYIMNNKHSRSPASEPTPLDLTKAVSTFVAKGGVIAVIADGETAGSAATSSTDPSVAADISLEQAAKVELLRCLAAKGAGFTALQYSLRMNRKDIRQLASENGVKISFSQPVRALRREVRHDSGDVDDVVAGHALHYSSLGYTASEIAQVLDLTLRQVWDIGKAYRIEFRQRRDSDTP
ncbi:hypothetical protein GIV52_22335 [Pseudomonas syringae]|uniref:Uncharacterized protein n=2 Tax=Pseudomonas syringae TaxID=317 RepID=A0A9Q4FI01_PSESX|nr:hypothetical protein AO070_09560 [Pseudomonas syringae pv. syringae PD2766]MCF5469420.1 hypothetical protein [Pseudomonas syringae]MCF5475212.1 hypothetical protein [Pseudomonas syringae]MCF5484738.1 hypothetical protein [Pseudomonas syringae]MCF5490076.1 hypothetical protein [Pseudomonas syringae]